MHYSSIPEKPLIVRPNGRIEKPQKIFFFERKDGSVFYAQENEAWTLYSKGNQMVGLEKDRPKLIGTGNGLIFNKAVQDAKAIGASNLYEAQEILRKGVADELEACRGNIQIPGNHDKFGDGASFI